MFGLLDDSYGKLFAPFDGNTKLPVLFTAFSILYFFLSTRLNTLRIFPKQKRYALLLLPYYCLECRDGESDELRQWDDYDLYGL